MITGLDLRGYGFGVLWRAIVRLAAAYSPRRFQVSGQQFPTSPQMWYQRYRSETVRTGGFGVSDHLPYRDVASDRSLAPPAELLPSHTPTCMGCGPDNPHGLHLVVYRCGDEVYADVTFDERHIGAPGLAHGGAVAAACDDVLGFTLWIAGTPAVTRTLTVEYLRPVPLHQTHRITAHIVSREGRALHVTATGTGEGGIARFTASAVFIVVSPEHFAAHGDVSAFGDLLEQFSRRGGLDPEPS